MITNTMTPREVINALQEIDDYVLGRMVGLSIKNSKKLKSKFVKNNEIMSKSSYLIPKTHDTVVVYATKIIQYLKGKEYSTMGLHYYIPTYYNTYIIASINSVTKRVDMFAEFSGHSVERLKMRLGKDFDTFFKEDFLKNSGIIQPVEYNYNGDENEYVAHIGDAFVIMESEDSGHKLVAKTILSNDDLHSNQLQYKLDSKMGGDELWEETMKQLDQETVANLKGYKKLGIIRAVA